MSLIRLIAVTCGVFCVLSLIGKKHDSARAERWGIFAMGALLVVSAAQMSLIRLIAVTCGVFCVLSLIGKKHDSARAERWGIFAMGALLVVSAVRRSYTAPFWWGCLLLMGIVTVYAFFGWNAAPEPASVPGTRSRGWMWGTGAAAAAR